MFSRGIETSDVKGLIIKIEKEVTSNSTSKKQLNEKILIKPLYLDEKIRHIGKVDIRCS